MAPSTGRTPVDINSVIAGMVDRGVGIFYDNLITAAGTQLNAQYTLFSYQLGTNDPITAVPKTLINTNMEAPKYFPPPQCLVLMDMGFFFRGMLLADILKIQNNYYFEFFIDQKRFFYGFTELYPSGLGNFGSSGLSGDYSWVNGAPFGPSVVRRFGRYSKYIAPLQQFTARLTCGYTTPPTLTTTALGGTGLNMYWVLDGLRDTSVA